LGTVREGVVHEEVEEQFSVAYLKDEMVSISMLFEVSELKCQ